jgi:hypothetical protein
MAAAKKYAKKPLLISCFRGKMNTAGTKPAFRAVFLENLRKEEFLMSNHITNVMKGIGAGMAAGVAMGVVGATMMKSSGSSRKLKKNSKRAIQAMENLLDNAQIMFK